MSDGPQDTLRCLVQLFPAFDAYWRADDNDFVLADGYFTHHGLFLEFTNFFRENSATFGHDELRKFTDAVNSWFGGASESLDNAVATCFLEGIAGEPSALRLKPLLSQPALAYLAQWEPEA